MSEPSGLLGAHRLQSEFLKDEKEKSSETVHRENRKEKKKAFVFV